MSDTDQLTTQDILARTMWGEARNQGDQGLQAVANVVINRFKSGKTWWGHDVRSVCLAPFQFSCWLVGDPNRAKLLAVSENDKIFRLCIDLAGEAIDGDLPDVTNGATSYYARTMPQPPKWAADLTPCAEIGAHIFFQT